ncbi:MAG: nucleotidyltransferase family protein [Candidatus Omnitrophica bacterium]|nr:nucleotidyltransferase family protein [Candidatus Omnitrophota bacterium]
MDFAKVLTFLLENFKKHGVRYALMGGFALHAAGYSRAARDIDILILKEDMPKVRKLLLSIGYEVLHESEDIVNFKGALKELGQIDFLLAHRSYTKNMCYRFFKSEEFTF